MSPSPDFRIGERVRLSALGKMRSPRILVATGEVVRSAQEGGSSLDVLFDGNKVPTRLHVSYIERIEK